MDVQSVHLTKAEEVMMVPGMGGRPERELSRQALADVLRDEDMWKSSGWLNRNLV